MRAEEEGGGGGMEGRGRGSGGWSVRKVERGGKVDGKMGNEVE